MHGLFAAYQHTPGASKKIRLLKETHIRWCLNGLENMPGSMAYLDCSRPWLCYWILHALELMGWSLTEKERQPAFQAQYKIRSSHVVDWLKRCFRRCVGEDGVTYGGYGGGPGQLPHLAPTYASICALCIIGTEEAYASIPRDELLRWMLRLKTKDNSFQMHENGEVDIRAIYTCMAVACILDILTPELTNGVADYLVQCQTFEGGIGCEPYDEAHGGYTFCGLAAMTILKERKFDMSKLIRWIVARQKRLEGGFDGRTNKLVDSCYSFWVGATYAITKAIICESKETLEPRDVAVLDYLHMTNISKEPPPSEFLEADVQDSQGDNEADQFEDIIDATECMPSVCGDWFFDEVALQEYLLLCCQNHQGGLRDKPEKRPDYYHTCYALSGLAIAQHGHYHDAKVAKSLRAVLGDPPQVLGDQRNLLECNSPIFNIGKQKVLDAFKYFGNRDRF